MTAFYRICGIASPVQVALNSPDVIAAQTVCIIPGRSRAGITTLHEVAADAVIQVTLENGWVLWLRADDLIQAYATPVQASDGLSSFEFERLIPKHSMKYTERGLVGLVIKLLTCFTLAPLKTVAQDLCQAFETKILAMQQPGLYRCALADPFALTPLNSTGELSLVSRPILILLHGTASNTEASFGDLWHSNNRSGRLGLDKLKAVYGDQVLALEHRSLTRNPIQNALALVQQLPEAAELHLLSHSSGGLIGELLCLAHCEQIDLWLDTECRVLFSAPEYSEQYHQLQQLVNSVKKRRLRVTRFVRIACPARGTALAGKRLDRWLSVMSNFMDHAWREAINDVLLAVVQQRTDPRALLGLAAMLPDGPLVKLLNYPKLSTQTDLTVIAGSLNTSTAYGQQWQTLSADWFCTTEHDLVVNTDSMSGGLLRSAQAARLLRLQSADINHFHYLVNPDSIQAIVYGLLRQESDNSGFQPLSLMPHALPSYRSALARSRASHIPRPLAIVLPGIMGSELNVADECVWLNYVRLALGGLTRVRLAAPEVAPGALLDKFYAPLITFLARSHHVELFAYDWRLSLKVSAQRLMDALELWLPQAEKYQQPVHLVAHSMGGLVVRTMLADQDRGQRLWQRIIRLPNSRFLMLGTPNFGSYEAFRWLTGCNPTQAKLALLDFAHDTTDIVDLVREFPGLLELLPFGAEDADFMQPQLWHTIKTTLAANWQVPEEKALRSLAATWTALRNQILEPQYCCYVAGCQPQTIVGYHFTSETWFGNQTKRLEFTATHQGDGTVPWRSGQLPGVSLWYLEDTAHDALCTQWHAFPAYVDLLHTGKTKRLSNVPPASQRTTGLKEEPFTLPTMPLADARPSPKALEYLGFSGSLMSLAQTSNTEQILRVRIVHGDLAYTRYPVMVGHYLGDTIVSAEKSLDNRLPGVRRTSTPPVGGALTERLDLGIYPGNLHSHAIFFHPDALAKPAGAIVIGLGAVGELTPVLLTAAVQAALLDYALQVANWPNTRFGLPGARRNASVSCLLIGSGAGGFALRDTLEAILRAALSVNAKLADAQLDAAVNVQEIEFIELYQDIAAAAVDSLRQILLTSELAASVSWAAQQVESGQAGRQRICFAEAPGWWQRLEIFVEAETQRLRFIALTDRARAEETLTTGQLTLAEAFIQEACNTSSANSDVARTLFELLLPVRLKELAPKQHDLVLLLDARAARYPWELLENRWSEHGRPPAVHSGLIRQLKTQVFRPHPAHAVARTVLVIGHPVLGQFEDFGELPGAREEARQVVEVFKHNGYQVTACIDSDANTIVANLHRDAWRILHLAGHGVFDYPLKATQTAASTPISGMVIGDKIFLTPGDVEQMRWVPELVFINCCHLGRTISTEKPRLNHAALAANLGVQFIRMGVKAVIAAGWAVDDKAASAFAEVFYQHLLNGETFGHAVRLARENIWLRFREVNTWGAYQCYGDPDYRLYRNPDLPTFSTSVVYNTAEEWVIDLYNIIHTLRVATIAEFAGAAQQLAHLQQRVPEAQLTLWQQRADVCAALGLAYGELGEWQQARNWLQTALHAERAECPLFVVEQLANFEARQAIAIGHNQDSLALTNALKLIDAAIRRLKMLLTLGETEARLNLLGNFYKYLAWLQVQDAKMRQEALLKMEKYYRKACIVSKAHASHAVINWALATLLSNKPLEACSTHLATLRTTLQQRNTENPTVEDTLALVDLTLIQYLNDCLNTATALNMDIATLKQGYQTALARGASANAYRTVQEQLEFICTLLPATHNKPELAQALYQLRAML